MLRSIKDLLKKMGNITSFDIDIVMPPSEFMGRLFELQRKRLKIQDKLSTAEVPSKLHTELTCRLNSINENIALMEKQLKIIMGETP